MRYLAWFSRPDFMPLALFVLLPHQFLQTGSHHTPHTTHLAPSTTHHTPHTSHQAPPAAYLALPNVTSSTLLQHTPCTSYLTPNTTHDTPLSTSTPPRPPHITQYTARHTAHSTQHTTLTEQRPQHLAPLHMTHLIKPHILLLCSCPCPQIRASITGEHGNCILTADYSQLELRVLAHLTKCRGLVDAFTRGGDIHSETAYDMFQVVASPQQQSMLGHFHNPSQPSTLCNPPQCFITSKITLPSMLLDQPGREKANFCAFWWHIGSDMPLFL